MGKKALGHFHSLSFRFFSAFSVFFSREGDRSAIRLLFGCCLDRKAIAGSVLSHVWSLRRLLWHNSDWANSIGIDARTVPKNQGLGYWKDLQILSPFLTLCFDNFHVHFWHMEFSMPKVSVVAFSGDLMEEFRKNRGPITQRIHQCPKGVPPLEPFRKCSKPLIWWKGLSFLKMKTDRRLGQGSLNYPILGESNNANLR